MKEEKSELSELFLKEFVKYLIKNSISIKISTENMKTENVIIADTTPSTKKPIQAPKQKIIQKQKMNLPQKISKQGFMPSIYNKETSSEMPLPIQRETTMRQTPVLQKPTIEELPQTENLQNIQEPSINIDPLLKLKQFINDRSITRIESPGPDKNLIIRKSGKIIKTPFALSKDDINKLMKEFSYRTKIPLINGIYKAAIDDFIVTAVISEYAGTRFHIDKKPRMITPPMPQRFY